jgi:hypothetical protein
MTDALTVAVELVRNTSMTPAHVISVAALGNAVIGRLKKSLASGEYNGMYGSTSTN